MSYTLEIIDVDALIPEDSVISPRGGYAVQRAVGGLDDSQTDSRAELDRRPGLAGRLGMQHVKSEPMPAALHGKVLSSSV